MNNKSIITPSVIGAATTVSYIFAPYLAYGLGLSGTNTEQGLKEWTLWINENYPTHREGTIFISAIKPNIGGIILLVSYGANTTYKFGYYFDNSNIRKFGYRGGTGYYET